MPMMRDLTHRWLPRWVRQKMGMTTQRFVYPPDFTPEQIALVAAVGEFTMTSPERVVALAEAVRYVVDHAIPGAFVECGVWRGGSVMVVARTLLAMGVRDRDLLLFDTFTGMTPPGERDVEIYGGTAADVLAKSPKEDGARNLWCLASQEDVARNLASTGYPMGRIHLVAGTVEETLPAQAPDAVALLRLDTDWYSSTRHELETLYPRLSPGGVMIVDDYGHWSGARQAVDEYLTAHPPAPLLHRIDYTGRMAIKPWSASA